MTEEEFRQAFDNYFDCYADTEILSLSEPALTKEKFIELLKNHNIIKTESNGQHNSNQQKC